MSLATDSATLTAQLDAARRAHGDAAEAQSQVEAELQVRPCDELRRPVESKTAPSSVLLWLPTVSAHVQAPCARTKSLFDPDATHLSCLVFGAWW